MQQLPLCLLARVLQAAAQTEGPVDRLRATVTSTDYVENEAFASYHDVSFWGQPTGSEQHAGLTTFTQTDTHYYGGYSTTGLFSLAGISWHCVLLSKPAPDAKWEFSFERSSWEDHAALFINFIAAGASIGTMDLSWTDCSVTDCVTMMTGMGARDSQVWEQLPSDAVSIKRSSFSGNGNYNSDAVGPGGVGLEDALASGVPAVDVVSTVFVGNAGGTGPAFSCHDQAMRDLRITGCLFRENVAHVSVSFGLSRFGDTRVPMSLT